MKANPVRLILWTAIAGMLIVNFGCGTTPEPEEKVVVTGPKGDAIVVKNMFAPNAQYDLIYGNIQLFTVTDPASVNGELGYSAAIIQMEPKQRIPLHYVKNSEVLYVIEGDGMLKINGSAFILKPGIIVYIPPEARQSLLNNGKKNLKFMVIDSPPWTPGREVDLNDQKARNQRRKKIEKYSDKEVKTTKARLDKAVKDAGGAVKNPVNESQKLIDKNKDLLKQDSKLGAETQDLSKDEKKDADNALKQMKGDAGDSNKNLKQEKPANIPLNNPKMDKLLNYKKLPQNKTAPSDSSLKTLMKQDGLTDDLSGGTEKTSKDTSLSDVEKLLKDNNPSGSSSKKGKGSGDVDLSEIEKLLKNQDTQASDLLKKLDKELDLNKKKTSEQDKKKAKSDSDTK